jgi:hypothetical protein
MVEHGFNHVDESPTRSRGRFLEVLGFGLLAVAGGAGGGLLAGRLWPDALLNRRQRLMMTTMSRSPCGSSGSCSFALGVTRRGRMARQCHPSLSNHPITAP